MTYKVQVKYEKSPIYRPITLVVSYKTKAGGWVDEEISANTLKAAMRHLGERIIELEVLA